MNTTFDLERQLRVHLESSADRSVRDGQLAWILEEVRRRPQRPGWLAALRSPSMTAETVAVNPVAGRRLLAPILVAGLILLLILAAVFAAGGRPFAGAPTNGRIVFGRYDSVQKDTVLYAVNPDGSQLIKLHDQALECPYWSPDSTRITVTSASMNGDGTDFRQMAGLAPGASTVILGGVTLGCGVWSHDGQYLAAEGWNDADTTLNGVYTFRASDGGDLRRLTTAPSGHDVPIGYSPDGKLFAFMGDLGGNKGGLFLINGDGTNRRRLGGLTIGGADWAPDGRSILVESSLRLYSVDLATGQATPIKIAAEPDADIGNPQWSPDGKRILFNRDVNNHKDFFTMRADGTDVVQVTNDPDDDYFADWGTSPLIN